MAKNTTNNRLAVKWVRDKAKAAYIKDSKCCICDSEIDLELHHFNSITVLLQNWANHNKYDISTDDGILAVRDEFIAAHQVELYDQVRTLCNTHHVALHRVFGKAPALRSEPKQERWVNIQKDKFNNIDPKLNNKIVGSFFSAFT